MTAKEIREYRLISRKLVEVEEKNKLLEELKRRKVCLAEEEMFFRSLQSKFKSLSKEGKHVRKQHVSLTLKYKIRDNILQGVKMRTEDHPPATGKTGQRRCSLSQSVWRERARPPPLYHCGWQQES